MFIITVSQDFAVGVVFSTRELAENSAIRMGLREYQILQVFAKGQRVVFRESETGPEELGTVRESLDTKFYTVDLDDGTGVEAFYVELTPAPADAPPAPVVSVTTTAAKIEPASAQSSENEPKADSLSAALLATIKEFAEYDHPCDSDEGDLSKAHGAVSIHVLRELLARHS